MRTAEHNTAKAGRRHRRLAFLERCAWTLGTALLGFYLVANVHAARNAQLDLAMFFEQRQAADATDRSLWSESRKAAYDASLTADLGLPEGLLRVAAIDLVVPIREGVDELTLNRAIGRVPGTAEPGDTGNMVLAGHRDGFFRRLGQLQTGDRIEVQTLNERFVYAIEKTVIVDPDAVHVMEPTPDQVLTLITCYPFYFVGPAPKRFVVRARMIEF